MLPATMPGAALVLSIARALVDQPDDVQISEGAAGEKAIILELRVHPADVGQALGKHGRHAPAMRKLLAAVRKGDKHRYVLEILPLKGA